MSDNEIQQLMDRFPYIVKWEKYMGRFEYYLNDQLRCAARENAPANAIYRFNYLPTGRVNHWVTTDEIENPDIVLAWRLACPQCGGRRARIKGCKGSRHDIYDAVNFV